MPSDSAWDLITVPWHLNEHIPGFPAPAGPARDVSPVLPQGSQVTQMKVLQQAVAQTVAPAARPLLLAGDCAAAVGAMAGLQVRHKDVAVVWLDGHGDFNTPVISASGYLAGMSLAMLTGRTPELISDDLSLRPVADRDAVLVDARDLDPAERDLLAASQVRRVPAEPDALRRAVGELDGKPVYLHIDADVIDGTEEPGLRFPVRDGPSLSRIEECLTVVRTVADVTAACLTCSWSPSQVGTRPVRDTIARLTAAFGARVTWPTGP